METASVNIDAIYEELKPFGGKWRTYPNPMRSDGLFVGQVAEQEPYMANGSPVCGFDGVPHYPAVPHKAKSYHSQLPHADAEELVRRLNTPEESP